jgi:opacity protein-like surface antigen
MKRLLGLALVAMFISSEIQAQDDFKFGVSGGLITSTLNNKIAPLGFNLVNTTLASGTGFYVGGIAAMGISEKFGAQAEFLYAKAGDLEYIQVPVMVKYYIIDGLYAQVGPQINLSTNANQVSDIIEELFNENDVIGVNTLGIDLGFGAGYEILENLAVQARYSVELSNRIDGVVGSISKGKVSNFTIGVAFFL